MVPDMVPLEPVPLEAMPVDRSVVWAVAPELGWAELELRWDEDEEEA
jgi:hypothetical protein